MKRPTLKVFLEMPCGQALEDIPVSVNMKSLIREWALDPEYGGLPDPSGRSFANWIDGCWDDWTEEPEVTVKDVLEGAVSEWCGGRSF